MNNNVSAFEQLPKIILHQIVANLELHDFLNSMLVNKKMLSIGHAIIEQKEFEEFRKTKTMKERIDALRGVRNGIVHNDGLIHQEWKDWQDLRIEKKQLYKIFLDHWNKIKKENGIDESIKKINRRDLFPIGREIELAIDIAKKDKKSMSEYALIKKADELFINTTLCVDKKYRAQSCYVILNDELKDYVTTWEGDKPKTGKFVDLCTNLKEIFSTAMKAYAKRLGF